MKLPLLKHFGVSALLSLCSMFDWGYDNAYVSTAQDAFRDHFMNVSDRRTFGIQLSTESFDLYWSAIVYSLTVGLIFGTLFAPILAEKFGRKKGLVLAAIWQLLASILAGISVGLYIPEVLCVARFLQGLAQGIEMVCLTLLLQESSPTETRGFVSTLQNVGTAFSAFLGVVFGLPDLLGRSGAPLAVLVSLGAFPAVILVVATFFVPETPKFLVLTKYDLESAEKSIEFYYGNDVNCQTILNKIQEEGQVDTDKSSQIRALFTIPKLRGAVFRALLAVSIPVFCGILPLRTYSTDILEAVGLGRLDWIRGLNYADLGTIFMALLFLIASLFAPFLVESFGRKGLLLLGGGVSTLSLMGLGVFRIIFHYSTPVSGVNFTGWASMACLCVSVIFLGSGPAAVQYFIAAELVPQHSRAFAVGVVTIMQQILTLIIGFSFLPIFDEIHGFAILIMFTVPALICLLVLFFKLPETKGREVVDTIKELEELYSAGSKISSRNTSVAGFTPTDSEMEFSFIEK